MSVVAAVLILTGALTNVFAGVGLVRLSSPYAQFHAAGKASPVSFILIACGVAIEMGWSSALHLGVAVVAVVVTVPVGVHLLFRAVHRTQPDADRPPELPAGARGGHS